MGCGTSSGRSGVFAVTQDGVDQPSTAVSLQNRATDEVAAKHRADIEKDVELASLAELERARNKGEGAAQPATAPVAIGWDRCDGDQVEDLVGSGAVAVLDAAWLVSFAASGGILARRQLLPAEAFLDVSTLKSSLSPTSTTLHLIVLSYAWLTPKHPDPRGTTLRLLAKVLSAFIELWGGRKVGVFWDFGSLHQHPDVNAGLLRTPSEQELFTRALSGLGTLYAHRSTWVLRVTTFPKGYPEEYEDELPANSNTATYAERGWTFVETSWACMAKGRGFSDAGPSQVWDLGKLDTTESSWYEMRDKCTKDKVRPPPLTPDKFETSLSSKRFTNEKDDRPLVVKLYTERYRSVLQPVRFLQYAGLEWGDEEAARVAEVLTSGALPNLEYLDLSGNDISDEGAKTLAIALATGSAPRLTQLHLSGNPRLSKGGDRACRATLQEKMKALQVYTQWRRDPKT